MQGTLRDFRVAEILQLVAVQQKTGLLRVQNAANTLTFYFEHGKLVSCRDRRRAVADPLLDFLRRTGWIDPNTARQIEADAQSERIDLADLLLQRQLVTEEELEQILDDLAQDLITSSYTWSDGSYLFIAGDEALLGLKHRMSRNIEGLLMEAARRADEWPRLLEKIPGPETIVGDLKDVPSGLDETTRRLLERLQQPISMHELASTARIPEFEVYETVAQAIENDMARVLEIPRRPAAPAAFPLAADAPRTATPPPPGFPERRRIPALPRSPLGARAQSVVQWLVAVVISVTCLGASARQLQQRLAPTIPSVVEIDAARARLERDLEVHRAVFGHYPTRLDDLVEADLTSPRTLERAAVASFSCNARGDRYALRYDRRDPS
jgi:hypothetical protein